jgi:predicted nucleic acid-binding protein
VAARSAGMSSTRTALAERVFIDTNVIVYADDLDAGAKRERAQEILHRVFIDGNGVVSTQVLQEFFVAATRKLGVAPEVARRKVELLSRLDVVTIEPSFIVEAIDLHRLHSLSFWDALIVQAAAASGCRRLLTEDLQSGRTIAGVQIENPFAGLSEPST